MNIADMKTAAVIPVRMDSTRYPGKPLCDIQGMTMTEHVYRRTEMSDTVDEIYVATPDIEIKETVEEFGGNVIMTGKHPRATDRVAEAAEQIDADIIIVMQGDEPLVYPDMIDNAVRPVIEHGNVKITNLAKPILNEDEYHDPNNVKVVADQNWNALYFSRSPIPYLHDIDYASAPVFHQVCVIPFEREFLFKFTDMDETILEKTESIDMLRLLENGHDIQLVKTDYDTYPVDTPEDHEVVSEKMATDDLFKKYSTK